MPSQEISSIFIMKIAALLIAILDSIRSGALLISNDDDSMESNEQGSLAEPAQLITTHVTVLDGFEVATFAGGLVCGGSVSRREQH